MTRMRSLAALAAAAGLSAWVTVPGLAASASADPGHPTAATRQDFKRLSTAGARAYDDVGLARLAIFEGNPPRAEHLVAAAEAAFGQAATDRATFVKAEDRLVAPASMHQAAAAPGADASTPKAWIPVAETFVLDETLAAPPNSANAVAKADASLHANRRQDAIRMLHVAHVSALDTVALAPLDASVSDTHRAAELMTAGDYYGANQSLRAVEDGVRYDTVDVNSKPDSTIAMSGGNAPAGDHIRP